MAGIPYGIELRQVDAGNPIEIRRGPKVRRVTVGREFEVLRDGAVLGSIRYFMRTKFRAIPRMRNVSYQSEAPVWHYRRDADDRWHEVFPSTRALAIEEVLLGSE